LYPIQPLSDQSLKEMALLNVRMMASPIQNRERSTRIVFQNAPGIPIAGDLILSSDKDHDRIRERLRKDIHLKRVAVPLTHPLEKRLISRPDPREKLVSKTLPMLFLLHHCYRAVCLRVSWGK
jgi:hypothetical protein